MIGMGAKSITTVRAVTANFFLLAEELIVRRYVPQK
jgi:hypothetical protein